ncbi:hypothetical protein VTL71DRAFT_15050 [Oculimacula yallundae]|uniref:Heterokaryon incompatibility domain-containing protein n=1 Tax=Oculimacula yallundae TaxID=86028 RepID=A0ABR4CG77_9HELO
MRLLSTSTLELVEFMGEIPPYAILSHTWEEDEVSYQEMQSRAGHTKAGYQKIKHCCLIAASDGFQYAWVDTCCIDKTSSSELSEAINSMYRWYAEAGVCYVYLSDVDLRLHSAAAIARLRRSRWFSRGWTLQELIAPASILFFDRNWQWFGTKSSFESVITDITGIDANVLAGK